MCSFHTPLINVLWFVINDLAKSLQNLLIFVYLFDGGFAKSLDDEKTENEKWEINEACKHFSYFDFCYHWFYSQVTTKHQKNSPVVIYRVTWVLLKHLRNSRRNVKTIMLLPSSLTSCHILEKNFDMKNRWNVARNVNINEPEYEVVEANVHLSEIDNNLIQFT